MSQRIGETFCASGYATPEQIEDALRIQSGLKTHKVLGQILIEQGIITQEQAQLYTYAQSCVLLDLVARINSTMDHKSLLSAVMESAKVLMEAEASSLMLLDRSTGELIVTLPTGPASAEISGIRIPPGKGFGGWVASHGLPLVVPDAQSDPRFFGDIAKGGFQTKSLVCVPLRNGEGEIIGVIQAVNKRDGRPFTGADTPVFLALADQASIALEKERLHQESTQRKLLEQQLELARTIQTGFWPKQMPVYAGFGFAAFSIPAAQVGGDYYDFIPVDSERCAVAVGDVCGKGVPAALLMSMLRAMLRAEAEADHPVEKTISQVNHVLVQDTPSGEFVTLFYGVLDAPRREFTHVNAGHNPPLLYDRRTGKMELLSEGGPVVGILDNFRFESMRLRLQPGQVLVIYTDGVTEAQNAREDQFGEDRLQALVRENADEDAKTMLDRIYQAVLGFVQGAPQHDDLTLVIMKVEDFAADFTD